MTRKEIGVLIRRARELAGWSATKLALRLDVSGQSVSLAERGGTPWPRGSQAKAVNLLLDALADKHCVQRIRPRLTPCGASRLLAVVVARTGINRDGALARWG